MFDLDLRLFSFIYNNSKALGNSLGYGAYEGFLFIFIIIAGISISILNKRDKIC